MAPTAQEIDALLTYWSEEDELRVYKMDRYTREEIGSRSLGRLSEGLRGRELFLQVKQDLGLLQNHTGISPMIFFLIVKVMVMLAETFFLYRSR